MDSSSEDRLIDWLRRIAPGDLLGNDVARLGNLHDAVITLDHQIEGTHFPTGLDPAWIARRLLAVNLSDIAASGARATYALLGLAVPTSFDHRRFLRALTAACRRHEVLLAGGDTAASRHISLSLCLLGARPAGGRLLGRHTARAGDLLWLGGTVGESAMGRHLLDAGARIEGRKVHLPARFRRSGAISRAAARAVRRHLAPSPQIELGLWLGRRRRATAIDVSDGLGLDLARLCRASGVGARISERRLPLAIAYSRICRILDQAPIELALSGGEDYVLLFALPARVTPPEHLACTPIGRVTHDRSMRLERDGKTAPLEATGWSHLDPDR